jgi:hypothetical protein
VHNARRAENDMRRLLFDFSVLRDESTATSATCGRNYKRGHEPSTSFRGRIFSDRDRP